MQEPSEPEKRSDRSADEEPRWRQDFPVAWEADHYVTRRELAKFLTLGSALLALANVVIAIVARRPKSERFPERTIGRASAIAVGESQQFRYPTDADPCILVRTPAGLCAYSQVCTHLSCAVVHRAGDNDLFCPCHHGVFDVAQGRPIAGPPTRPLPRIRLVERGDDIVAVGVER
ncbi:MAG TPA: Rieske 2Fe-2S domain-containing protein [Polyangia bacterium]